jgi:hypothetical protein
MKEKLASTTAVFGGELSGHFYFRDNFNADSGAIAFASVVSPRLAHADKPMSEVHRAGHAVRAVGRDQLRDRGQGSSRWPNCKRAYPEAENRTTWTASPWMWDRVVVQRPREQHRTAAASES